VNLQGVTTLLALMPKDQLQVVVDGQTRFTLWKIHEVWAAMLTV